MPVVQRAARVARQSREIHEGPRAAAAKKQAAGAGALKIRVFTMEDGAERPVGAAKVTVKGRSQVTPASGEVTFTGVPAGKRLVTVRHECFPELREHHRVPSDSTLEIPARMERVSLKEAAERSGIKVGSKKIEVVPAGPYLNGAPFYSAEFHGTAYGTFWNSRSPDYDANPNPPVDNRPVVDKGDLSLMQVRFDDAVYNHFKDDPKASDFYLQGTPLVWPRPDNSPGWPNPQYQNHVWKKSGWPGEYLRRHARKNGKIDKDLVREKVDEIHRRYIEACMDHNKAALGGRIKEWVVANEILNLKFDGEARKHKYWGRYYGVWEKDKKQIYNHVLKAFEAAHKKDKDAVLILNDFNVEGVDPDQERPDKPHPDKPGSPRGFGSEYYYYWKPRMFRALAVWLRKKLKRGVMGAQVASKFAVGFQMHIPESRKKKKYLASHVLENVKFFRKKGIKVYVTEIDVMGPKAQQYEVYRNLFAALVLGGCRSIMAWNVYDYEEAGKLHRCMFSLTEGCKEVGPPHRKPAYQGAVSGILHAQQLRAEIRKDR